MSYDYEKNYPNGVKPDKCWDLKLPDRSEFGPCPFCRNTNLDISQKHFEVYSHCDCLESGIDVYVWLNMYREKCYQCDKYVKEDELTVCENCFDVLGRHNNDNAEIIRLFKQKIKALEEEFKNVGNSTKR